LFDRRHPVPRFARPRPMPRRSHAPSVAVRSDRPMLPGHESRMPAGFPSACDCYGAIRLHPRRRLARCLCISEQGGHHSRRGRLVVLQRQDILIAPLDNWPSSSALHGSNHDRAAAQIQQVEQLRNGGDFDRCVIHGSLAKRQTIFSSPGTEEMQRRFPVRTVVGPAMGCAINHNHVRVRWLDGLHLPASSAGTVPGRSARTTDQRHRVRGCHSATPETWRATLVCCGQILPQ